MPNNAIPISQEDWTAGINIKNVASLFNQLTKHFTTKQPLPAIKVPTFEFFLKDKR